MQLIPFVLLMYLSIFYGSVTDESRTKIAVIDTGINITKDILPYMCRDQYDVTDKGLSDRHGHGTNITHLIAKGINHKKYCITMIKYVDRTVDEGDYYETALQVLFLVKGVKYVNLSINGEGEKFLERSILKSLTKKKIHVVVAAGNHTQMISKKLCTSFPACLSLDLDRRYFHTVGAYDLVYSNYGDAVTVLESGKKKTAGGYTMSGTSQATAIFTNKLVLKNEK